MGLMDNFGRIADVYIREKEQLRDAEKERRRVFTGHPFWPHEVLRDSIIFAAMMAVLLFYSWIIPPPLHISADPFAQAGFVFPDWYVLFSYGYLRWGEYLPQFDIPLPSIIGNFFGSPIISWNAGWWGAFLTGFPVGILALPPFLGGRAKRGVEDPWFATAGAIYLAHVWFISVYSINIFLDIYNKNRSDYCLHNTHAGLSCGVREPWVADLFNAAPWILTGVFIWVTLYFAIRWFLVTSAGARTTPRLGKQVALGTLLVTVLFSAFAWPVYDNGFWDLGGFGAMDDVDDLATMRGQPSDTLVAIEEGHDWDDLQTACLTYAASGDNAVWDDKMFSGDDALDRDDWCLIPANRWLDWTIHQPTQKQIIDFSDANNHQQVHTVSGEVTSGTNALSDSYQSNGTHSTSRTYALVIEDLGLETAEVDLGCTFRTSTRKAGDHTLGLSVSDSAGKVVASLAGDPEEGSTCVTRTVHLAPGAYTVDFTLDSTFNTPDNSNVTVDASSSVLAFQPLFLDSDTGMAVDRGTTNLDDAALMALTVENPTYHRNPKSLDAKLTYSLFIPCLGVGAVVYVTMRGMARGYEYEMNKCYGCDLCDDACPVRMFNAGDKLNIIYNTWNNEHDGVPMYSCLTCGACTNACPQLVDYDTYVDIRRNLVVGGPQEADIPHSILSAVMIAEAEEEFDDDFISVEDYPIDSNVGYYGGCVDYFDQEMIFSHKNHGAMNLGETTTAAFTLFEEANLDVSYLGRDFLKCSGHDQKWQGMTEVFEKLRDYNQKKLKQTGIDTLVTSCAECFRTFSLDYELDMKVMHTTEYLIENGYEVDLAVEDETKVTFHDPCRLGRHMNLYEPPRDLIKAVKGVELVEMEHNREEGGCCGVSAMQSCNEDSRIVRIARFEEVLATGADMMLTSCPKCVAHFECLKFEGDPRYDFEILDVVSFLARQVDEKKAAGPESIQIASEDGSGTSVEASS